MADSTGGVPPQGPRSRETSITEFPGDRRQKGRDGWKLQVRNGLDLQAIRSKPEVFQLYADHADAYRFELNPKNISFGTCLD